MVAALLVVGCGGGGGGSDTVPCLALSFDRALQTPANGDVYLDQSASTCSTVEVGVVVSNLDDIYTAGFDITYPTGLLDYTSYTLGPLLQKTPQSSPLLVIVTETAGTIQVALSRAGTDPGVNAVGSEALINLRFTRVASGAGAIDFDTSGTSSVSDSIQDNGGVTLSTSFGPGHGGMVTIP